MRTRGLIKADFFIQTALIAIITILAIVYGVEKAATVWVLLMLWQIGSAFNAIFRTSGRDKYRFAFIWTWVAFYAILLAPGFQWFNIPTIVNTVILIGAPIALTTFYWLVTGFSFRRFRGHKGNFLPHTSF